MNDTTRIDNAYASLTRARVALEQFRYSLEPVDGEPLNEALKQEHLAIAELERIAVTSQVLRGPVHIPVWANLNNDNAIKRAAWASRHAKVYVKPWRVHPTDPTSSRPTNVTWAVYMDLASVGCALVMDVRYRMTGGKEGGR